MDTAESPSPIRITIWFGWSSTLEPLERKGKLPEERIAELDAIGFDWQPKREPWRRGIARLRAFHNKHGHYRIPITDPHLADFASRVRGRKRQGTLPAERIAELDAIGFDWNPQENNWTEQMARLLSFRKQHGHYRVPGSYPDQRLVAFVRNARARKRRGALSTQRIAELEAIGFTWTRPELDCAERMTRLRAFREKHGHCRVPSAYPERALARFVIHARKLRRHGRLPEERIAELDAIGFDRKPPAKTRTEGIARLRAFKNEHGHCWVRSTDPDRWLANFAAKARSRKRHGRLPAHQIAELDALGFDWNPLENNWAEQMARLLSFREKHGHCRVPSAYPVRRLAHFVFSARIRKRKGTLSAQRIAELNAIGFTWSTRTA